MKKFYLSTVAFLLVLTGYAQSTFGPSSIDYGTYLGETIPLRDAAVIEPSTDLSKLRVVPNNLRAPAKVNQQALPLNGDPLVALNNPQRQNRETLVNFEGTDRFESQAIPPDPTGAAGPNHYVHAVNSLVKIFDKTGNLLAGPTSLGNFLGNGSSNGDPIVLYDQLADRFFVSQFQISNNALIVGVSSTPDPTGTYNVYEFALDAFPDYPHYSVWPDAYYLTANKFNGNTTYALDRDAILNGDPSPTIIGYDLPGVIRNPSTVFSPGPVNLLGTDIPADAPGYIVYFQDDGWANVSFDHIKVWQIVNDFDTPANSTISAPELIATQPFESTFFPFGSGDIRQPNTNQRIDAIQGVISYMANYRSFADHNSLLLNFNVDINGQNDSGIRWIELRNTGTGSFEIYQEGTWALPDGESRFMGSTAMDINGNIGLAYNVGSENTFVGMRYTGRLATDPLGQMTFEEQIIQDGAGNQTISNRFGDYAHLAMDPDGETFWYTGEYFKQGNIWATRIVAFNLENLPILSVTDNDNGAEMAVYPSGNDQYDIVLSTTNDLGDLQFDLIDIQGRKVSGGRLDQQGPNYRTTISTASLAKGVYVVKAFNRGSFEEVKKVILK
jgi:hypothetical protein